MDVFVVMFWAILASRMCYSDKTLLRNSNKEILQVFTLCNIFNQWVFIMSARFTNSKCHLGEWTKSGCAKLDGKISILVGMYSHIRSMSVHITNYILQIKILLLD